MTLDEALDELYGVDPDEFVAERKRLARELKDAGDRARRRRGWEDAEADGRSVGAEPARAEAAA